MNDKPPTKALVPVTARGEATRRKLLEAAEIEFGTKGFPAASVSGITQRADVGQGTFYLYFHSKEEVFETLVQEIGAALVATLGDAAGKKPGERESHAVSLLLEFAVAQPGRQRILDEVQFVDAVVFRRVREKVVAAVAAHLSRRSDATVRAAALIGAAAAVAMQHGEWGGKPIDAQLVESVLGV